MKEGKLLAKRNGNIKSWLVKSKQLHLSSIQEEEDDPFSMMEVDKTMDIGREQRKAEAKATQESWQAKVICGMLAREICSGVSQTPEVCGYIFYEQYDGECLDGGTGKGGMEIDDGQPAGADEGARNDRGAGKEDCRSCKRREKEGEVGQG
jgi:hypothetical protein